MNKFKIQDLRFKIIDEFELQVESCRLKVFRSSSFVLRKNRLANHKEQITNDLNAFDLRPSTFDLRPLLLSFFLLLSFTSAQTLTVLTHDSFSISEDVTQSFTAETGIELEFLAAGDAGELVNRAILTKDAPLGDVLYGIDNSLLARAQNADIFEPYTSPELENVAEALRLEPQGLVTPVDVGLVNFNYDVSYFEEAGLEPPTDIAELSDEAYRGLAVVQNPATSSPGLAFMLATIDRFGEEGWLEYWAELRDNDLMVTAGWNDAYYTAFSLYDGDRPIVLSYATSPAAEVMFAEEALDDAPSANLFCEACVYQQIEAAGILRGSENVEAAQMFIDYMLSEAFQADIPENMFVYPARSGVAVPEAFNTYAQQPSEGEIAGLESQLIEDNVQDWLAQWTAVVEQGQAPKDVR